MKIKLYSILIGLFILSCKQNTNDPIQDQGSNVAFNMTETLVSELNWMNRPESFVVKDSALHIAVNEGSDFFNNPEDSSVVATAPYLYRTVAGDFVARVLVEPDFSSQWNAAALMVHLDSINWIKFAFENSDATGPGIVTVVTKGTSDDANGVVLNNENKIWLAIARKKNVYAMHWSNDGVTYKMVRLSSMPDKNVVKVGIEAQSPVGARATHKILHFEIEEMTMEDLRNIN